MCMPLEDVCSWNSPPRRPCCTTLVGSRAGQSNPALQTGPGNPGSTHSAPSANQKPRDPRPAHSLVKRPTLCSGKWTQGTTAVLLCYKDGFWLPHRRKGHKTETIKQRKITPHLWGLQQFPVAGPGGEKSAGWDKKEQQCAKKSIKNQNCCRKNVILGGIKYPPALVLWTGLTQTSEHVLESRKVGDELCDRAYMVRDQNKVI